MKNIGKLAVLGAVLAASASFVSAETIGSWTSTSGAGPNLNSAMNYGGMVVNNGPLSSFAQDPSAEIQTGTAAAVAIGAGSPWASAMTGTTWVSYTANTNPASSGSPTVIAPQGYYTFTTTFSTASTGIYNIALNVLADDTTAIFLETTPGVYVNEVLAGPLGNDGECSQSGINCETPTSESFNASLTGGATDTLVFVVEQTGEADFGLDFSGSVNAAPEPSSLMLLGSGMVGAAGMFFRRRQTV